MARVLVVVQIRCHSVTLQVSYKHVISWFTSIPVDDVAYMPGYWLNQPQSPIEIPTYLTAHIKVGTGQ
ncbi:hypothetical protein RSAG8_08098, partial [Rhizoctonia solani AG-8 WAC10335]